MDDVTVVPTVSTPAHNLQKQPKSHWRSILIVFLFLTAISLGYYSYNLENTQKPFKTKPISTPGPQANLNNKTTYGKIVFEQIRSQLGNKQQIIENLFIGEVLENHSDTSQIALKLKSGLRANNGQIVWYIYPASQIKKILVQNYNNKNILDPKDITIGTTITIKELNNYALSYDQSLISATIDIL